MEQDLSTTICLDILWSRPRVTVLHSRHSCQNRALIMIFFTNMDAGLIVPKYIMKGTVSRDFCFPWSHDYQLQNFLKNLSYKNSIIDHRGPRGKLKSRENLIIKDQDKLISEVKPGDINLVKLSI